MAYSTAAEYQSGLDRQKWAENLILQLPVEHDGRNSWLMNYGRGDTAVALRASIGLPFYEASLAAMPPAESSRRECFRYQKCEEGTAECHCVEPSLPRDRYNEAMSAIDACIGPSPQSPQENASE